MLISSTLILVFITTVLFGALMAPIVKFFTKGSKIQNQSLQDSGYLSDDLKNYSLQGFDGETLTIGDFDSFLNKPRLHTNKIQGLWKKIDDKILKPIFIDNYNTAREEHSQIAKEIMQLFENHEKKKMKQKAIKNLIQNNGINDINDDLEDLNNGIEMRESERSDSSTNLTKLVHYQNTDKDSSTNSNE